LEKYNDRRLCIFEIADVLGIRYGAISYHLARLRRARLVSVERYKMYLYYQLDTQELAKVICECHMSHTHSPALASSLSERSRYLSSVMVYW